MPNRDGTGPRGFGHMNRGHECRRGMRDERRGMHCRNAGQGSRHRHRMSSQNHADCTCGSRSRYGRQYAEE